MIGDYDKVSKQASAEVRVPSLLGDSAELCKNLGAALARIREAADKLHGPEPRDTEKLNAPEPIPTVRRNIDAAPHLIERIHDELSRLESRI